MDKGKFLRLLIVVLLGVGITVLAFLMLKEAPTGSFAEDDIASLSEEITFRFKDSGENKEDSAVTDVKFFICLNNVLKSLKSADSNLIRLLCYDEVLEKEAGEKGGDDKREAHVKNAITEARNIMFRAANPKEAIKDILNKKDAEAKNIKGLTDAIQSAFSGFLSAESSSDKREKDEELNTQLANLLIWLWLKGSLPENNRVQQFRKIYSENQDFKKFFECLDEESKEVANSKITVKMEKKEVTMPVIEHILTSIFQTSLYMGSGISQINLSGVGVISEMAIGKGSEEEKKSKSSTEGKGLVDILGLRKLASLFSGNKNKVSDSSAPDENVATSAIKEGKEVLEKKMEGS
ncbi:hypothetical protein EHEL_050180 [Encephalitozoon hellem ATCC 50504]|uniref:Uncharacterized protein n=1 Tax=Encephalitozoon hellem TaxID=27973 RepID=A0A9Q9FBE3_ENCHE|nr:uncharacterized protein EHEL_050180 [Encephalitozoon hellem ATCC 50504]AFM98229.1 hypothetical protein EHEL_050180 [Encephalitozoon hellem ATCC 50504]UTX43105.1 hypothetical protein GPU96_05g08440 [Encephalitozoon hellem]|eukprot:XP_003887210.1 hypothetical protein EHEL_050180 [Encephalitozoon hellem ATCC 50504]